AEPGRYHVRIDGPAGAPVVIAPSLGSGFGAALPWVLAGVVSFLALVLGVVLIIVGVVRGRRPAGRAAQVTRYAVPPAGWYRAPAVADRERDRGGRAWAG